MLLVDQVQYLFYVSSFLCTGDVYYMYVSDLMLCFIFWLKVQNKSWIFLSEVQLHDVCNLSFKVQNVMST